MSSQFKSKSIRSIDQWMSEWVSKMGTDPFCKCQQNGKPTARPPARSPKTNKFRAPCVKILHQNISHLFVGGRRHDVRRGLETIYQFLMISFMAWLQSFAMLFENEDEKMRRRWRWWWFLAIDMIIEHRLMEINLAAIFHGSLFLSIATRTEHTFGGYVMKMNERIEISICYVTC